jgi:hypothetical protein
MNTAQVYSETTNTKTYQPSFFLMQAGLPKIQCTYMKSKDIFF